MAKKKKKKKGGFIAFLSSTVSFFRDDRFRYAMGIVFMLAALFMLISFISYLFHWRIDQDFEWSRVLSKAEIKVENQGGKMGAWLCELSIEAYCIALLASINNKMEMAAVESLKYRSNICRSKKSERII